MSKPDRWINKGYMCLELNEAQEAICVLIEKIKSGQRDDFGSVALSFDFDHVLGHLCAAWHCAWLSDHRIGKLSAADYEAIRNSVPNWNMKLQLVDPNTQLITGDQAENAGR